MRLKIYVIELRFGQSEKKTDEMKSFSEQICNGSET